MDVPLPEWGASVAAATSWWWLCWQCSRLKQLSLPPLSNATYFIVRDQVILSSDPQRRGVRPANPLPLPDGGFDTLHDAFCALRGQFARSPALAAHSSPPRPVFSFSPASTVYPPPARRVFTPPHPAVLAANNRHASSREHDIPPRVSRRLLSPGAYVGVPHPRSARDGPSPPRTRFPACLPQC